jgi:hypothetical protein
MNIKLFCEEEGCRGAVKPEWEISHAKYMRDGEFELVCSWCGLCHILIFTSVILEDEI